MSFSLNYLPPKCGKFEWGHKLMSYSCWSLRISDKLRELKIPEIRDIDPMSISCSVDVSEGRYWWRVVAWDWGNRLSEVSGWANSSEEAINEAERVGELYWNQLVEGWMVEALRNGWRPPCVSSKAIGIPPDTFPLLQYPGSLGQ